MNKQEAQEQSEDNARYAYILYSKWQVANRLESTAQDALIKFLEEEPVDITLYTKLTINPD